MATGWMERALASIPRSGALHCRAEEFGKVAASTIQGLAFAELLAGNSRAARAYTQRMRGCRPASR